MKKKKSEEEKIISRRRFIKTAGVALGVGAAACGGTAYFGLKTPNSVEFPETSCGDGGSKRVLVAYASKCGAAAETANFIAGELCARGLSVDLLRAKDVKDASNYHSIILGSAVYMGKLLGNAESFFSNHQDELSGIPVALFDVCLTAAENTPEKQAEALAFLDPLRMYATPATVAAFPGRIALDTLPPLYRMIAKTDSEGTFAEKDYRDWDVVSAWLDTFPSGFLPA